MPSYVPAKRATAYVTYVSLIDSASGKLFVTNPTLAAGDVQVSIDGGALANLATLPVVTPAGSKLVKVSLSAAEMTGDTIAILFSDVAGAEWNDLLEVIDTSVRQIDDLATASALATVQTSINDLPTNAELETAFAAADDAVLAAIAALNNLSAAAVNAEMVDALSVDTYAEPGQQAPPATATIAAKLNYLYFAWRNKCEQTATTYSLYNDAGTVVNVKGTVSDDGTTFARQEIVSGP